MNPIIIQAIGFVGVLFFIISYQIKSNKMLFLLQLLGTATFCCQFLLLGATSGAVNLIGIIVRNGLLMKCRDWPWVRSKWTEIIFLAIFTIAFVATWQGLISLFFIEGGSRWDHFLPGCFCITSIGEQQHEFAAM